jgi:Lysylphosphatidylglycerol synthase TM region
MNDQENIQEEEIKKPSVLSQLIPYTFAVAILVFVFTGLSTNVRDERHVLIGNEWSEMAKTGVKSGTLEVFDIDGKEYLQLPENAEKDDATKTPDYEAREELDGVPAAIRRAKLSSIPDGGEVSVNYVKKVKVSEIWAIVKQADLSLFLPFMILHCLIFAFADVADFGFAYRWFNVPGMKIKELLEVRLAPYVIQVGMPPLAEVLFPLYMWRVKRIPVTQIMSSNFWAMLMDVAAMMSAITPAVIYNLFYDNLVPQIGYEWLVGVSVFWIIFAGIFLIWKTPKGKEIKERIAEQNKIESEDGLKKTVGGGIQLLRTFSLTKWHHVARAYGARLLLICSSLASSYIALTALGADPSLPLALIGIPIVVMSVFMPIGVGGYGGPQLIAWFIFVEIGKAGEADQVIAYSFLWSTGFLIGRAVIGMIFIRGFWKKCFPAGFSMS